MEKPCSWVYEGGISMEKSSSWGYEMGTATEML